MLNLTRLTLMLKLWFTTRFILHSLKRKRMLDPSKKSTYQLLETQIKLKEEEHILKFKATMKTHATMLLKAFYPFYWEHIGFSVKRCSQVVTKIYTRYTFDQEPFKKDLIIMNQVLRQNDKNDVKDFYKLLNNSNFGYDCRNNINNCSLELCPKVQ